MSNPTVVLSTRMTKADAALVRALAAAEGRPLSDIIREVTIAPVRVRLAALTAQKAE